MIQLKLDKEHSHVCSDAAPLVYQILLLEVLGTEASQLICEAMDPHVHDYEYVLKAPLFHEEAILKMKDALVHD